MTKKLHVQAKINGKPTDFLCEPRQSLLEVLRDVLQLTGSKEGCNNGNCGSVQCPFGWSTGQFLHRHGRRDRWP